MELKRGQKIKVRAVKALAEIWEVGAILEGTYTVHWGVPAIRLTVSNELLFLDGWFEILNKKLDPRLG